MVFKKFDIINKKLLDKINDEDLLLNNVKVNFILDKVNRLQTMFLCEVKGSFTQQSQRYVRHKFYKNDIDINTENVDKEDEDKIYNLIDELNDFYKKLSEIDKDKSKGRNKVTKSGIPIEDSRYILPLTTNSTISVTMKLKKYFKFVYFVFKNTKLFGVDENNIQDFLPNNTILNLYYSWFDKYKIHNYDKNYLDENTVTEIENDNFENVSLISNDIDLDTLTKSTLISTSSNYETSIQKYKSNDDKMNLIKRVVGYGHDSILEHSQTSFLLKMSMVTYHQFIRHRLSDNIRDNIFSKEFINDGTFVIPHTIQNSKYLNEYLELSNKSFMLRKYLFDKYNDYSLVLPLLLNNTKIKVIHNSNLRNDLHLFKQRLCMNAQWEIRELLTEKFKKLYNDFPLIEFGLPPCISEGRCKEGKLKCSYPIPKVKEIYLEKINKENFNFF